MKSRDYRMQKRADDVNRTRLRIVEAAVDLHRTEGLDSPVSAIAAKAGVTRATLYRHFPETESLFQACSTHWVAQQVLPNPQRWTGDDPRGRLRAALTDVYRYYADGADMLHNVELAKSNLPRTLTHQIQETDAALREALLALLLPEPAGQHSLLTGVIAHVLAFGTWHSLVAVHGIEQEAAVELMARLVESASQWPPEP